MGSSGFPMGEGALPRVPGEKIVTVKKAQKTTVSKASIDLAAGLAPESADFTFPTCLNGS